MHNEMCNALYKQKGFIGFFAIVVDSTKHANPWSGVNISASKLL